MCDVPVWRGTLIGRYIFVGGSIHDLISLLYFTQIEDIHLVREEDTGKSRGFAFVKYEDARSCAIAVDNLIGSQVSPLTPSYLESSSIPHDVLCLY